MTYIGHVKNGRIVLTGAPALPEGAEVKIELTQTPANETNQPSASRSLLKYSGIIQDLPADAAANYETTCTATSTETGFRRHVLFHSLAKPG